MLKYYQKLLALKSAPFMVAMGMNILLKPVFGGKGTILMFHRVIPKQNRQRIHNHLSLEITPEHLESIVQYFIQSSYDIIALDQLNEYLQKDKRFVVFTFDDGYKDNLTYAYPVFKKYSIPFTIYICNAFPHHQVFLWWYYLEELLLQNNTIKIDSDHFRLQESIESIHQKEKVFYQIREAINNGVLALDDFESVLREYQVELPQNLSNYLLSWEDIKQMAQDDLVTFGSHTLSHKALKSLHEDELKDEVTASEKELSKVLNKQIKHFAYPFGSKKEVSDREIAFVKKLGFNTATTTNLGNVFAEHQNHLFNLPRITVNAQTSLSVLKMQLSGLYAMLDNKCKRIVL